MELRYFEDYEIGEEFTTPSRTITESDVVQFAGLSGDYSELHISEEFAKKTMFQGRIAHGLLGLAITSGLEFQTIVPKMAAICSLGWTYDFIKPIKIGDTVFLKIKLERKHETKNSDRGILFLSCCLINQKGEIVQKGEHRTIVKRRNKNL